jgi:hypothetical protein
LGFALGNTLNEIADFVALRPLGTFCGVFDSVSPLSAPTNASAPVSSFSIAPPCSVKVFVIGTSSLPIFTSPLSVYANRHSHSSLPFSTDTA